jgi:hypothetical protein
MKAYGGVDVQIHIFLTSALVGGKWSTSRPGRFTPPPERAPGTHCIGGWVDRRAGLDDMEKWKFLTLPGREPRTLSHPARSQSLYRVTSCSLINIYWHWSNMLPPCSKQKSDLRQRWHVTLKCWWASTRLLDIVY